MPGKNKSLGLTGTINHPVTYENLHVTDQMEANHLVVHKSIFLAPGCTVETSDGQQGLVTSGPSSAVSALDSPAPVNSVPDSPTATNRSSASSSSSSSVSDSKSGVAAVSGSPDTYFVPASAAIQSNFESKACMDEREVVSLPIPESEDATLIFPLSHNAHPKEVKLYYENVGKPLISASCGLRKNEFEDIDEYTTGVKAKPQSRSKSLLTDLGVQVEKVEFKKTPSPTENDDFKFLRVQVRTDEGGSCNFFGVKFFF